MKKGAFVAFVVLLAVVWSGVLYAQTTIGLFSKYVLENGVWGKGGPALQIDVTTSINKKISAGVWVSTGRDSSLQEMDLTIMYDSKHIQGLLMYFDLHRVLDRRTADVVYPSLKFKYPIVMPGRNCLTPYFQIAAIVATRETSKSSGVIGKIGVFAEGRFAEWLTVTENYWLMRDGGVFGGQRGWLARVKTDVNLQISKRFKISPRVDWSKPITVTDRKTRWTYAVNITIN